MASYITGALRGGYNLAAWGVGQVTSRATNGIYTVQSASKGVISAALAVVNAAGDLATLGTDYGFRWAAKDTASSLNGAIGNTYTSLLRILNPNAQVAKLPLSTVDRNGRTQERFPLSVGRIIISDTVPALRGLAIRQQTAMDFLNRTDNKGGNWFNRQVTARIASPLMAVGMIVAAIACTVIGVLAAVLSVIPTFGMSKRVNTIAAYNLQTPGFILNQLHQGLLGIVRPELV